MKIVELRAENIKNLKVVEIRPEDGAVILTGKNGAGKSAVLDSIFIALTGKKLERPIRDGENRAEVIVDLGTYKVRRIFTAKGERLEVLNKDGDAKTSPQTFLDGILGELTFDPLAFANMEDKPQRQLLADLLGLNFDQLDKQRAFAYNERTIKNRELKSLETALHGMAKPAEEALRQEISMAEEISKVEALEAKAKLHGDYLENQDGWRDAIEEYKKVIAEKNALIDELAKRIETLKREIGNVEGNIEAFMQKAKEEIEPENVSPEQISAARAGLREIEAKNIAIRNVVKFDEALAKLETTKKEVEKLDKEISDIDQTKEMLVTAAKFPIEGLGITDEYVTYGGQPFSQLSTGQQWKISTAIAMALNPKLKVVLIREGSLLDKEGLQAVVDLAKEKDYQLWIEKVSDDAGVGIYIEDGAIPGQEKAPLPPEG